MIAAGNQTSIFNKEDNFKTILPFLEDFMPPAAQLAIQSNFLPLIKAYYKWLEQTGNVLDMFYGTRQINDYAKSYLDPRFAALFQKELTPLMLPAKDLNKRILFDTITNQYRRKGTQSSLDYFFRASYKSSPNILYPLDRVLYSDPAKENHDYVIRFIPDAGLEPEQFVGKHLIGKVSNSGVDILDCFRIRLQTYDLFQAIVKNTTGSIGGSFLLATGDGYDHIPTVTIHGDGSGATASATIDGDGGVATVDITNSGIGYTYAYITITPTGGDTITEPALCIPKIRGGFLATERVQVRDDPTLGGDIEGLVGGFVVEDGGADYVSGEVLTYTSLGNGIGLRAQVGIVKGGIDSIEIVDGGTGLVSPPTVVIEGDGTGATASVTLTNQTVTAINVTNAGTNYTYANVRLLKPVIDPVPGKYPVLKAVIRGSIQSIDIIDPGIRYSPLNIDEILFSVIEDQPFSSYDGYLMDTSSPIVNVAALSGTGAVIKAALSCVSTVLNVYAPRFRGTFRPQITQDYYVMMSLHTQADSSVGSDYTIGETVSQTDTITLETLWSATVVHWDSHKKLLHTTKFDVEKFDKRFSVIGGTTGVKRLLAGEYNHPLIVDRGDGQVNREYTYYIKSALSSIEYDYYLRANVHPAGLRYIAIVADEVVDPNFVGVDNTYQLMKIRMDTSFINPPLSKFIGERLKKFSDGSDFRHAGKKGLTAFLMSSVTGEFLHGEKITASGSRTGYVAAWIDGKLYVNVDTLHGAMDAGTVVTGATSGAVGTIINVIFYNNISRFMVSRLDRVFFGIGASLPDANRYGYQIADSSYDGNGLLSDK